MGSQLGGLTGWPQDCYCYWYGWVSGMVRAGEFSYGHGELS